MSCYGDARALLTFRIVDEMEEPESDEDEDASAEEDEEEETPAAKADDADECVFCSLAVVPC